MAKAKRKETETNKKTFQPDYATIKDASLALRAINHSQRQAILKLIDSRGELMVTDIYHQLKLEQSLTSAFLGRLRKAGVVITRKEGQKIFYRVNYDRLQAIEKASKIIAARN